MTLKAHSLIWDVVLDVVQDDWFLLGFIVAQWHYVLGNDEQAAADHRNVRWHWMHRPIFVHFGLRWGLAFARR